MRLAPGWALAEAVVLTGVTLAKRRFGEAARRREERPLLQRALVPAGLRARPRGRRPLRRIAPREVGGRVLPHRAGHRHRGDAARDRCHRRRDHLRLLAAGKRVEPPDRLGRRAGGLGQLPERRPERRVDDDVQLRRRTPRSAGPASRSWGSSSATRTRSPTRPRRHAAEARTTLTRNVCTGGSQTADDLPSHRAGSARLRA